MSDIERHQKTLAEMLAFFEGASEADVAPRQVTLGANDAPLIRAALEGLARPAPKPATPAQGACECVFYWGELRPCEEHKALWASVTATPAPDRDAVDRYEPSYSATNGDPCMVLTPNGGWVRYEATPSHPSAGRDEVKGLTPYYAHSLLDKDPGKPRFVVYLAEEVQALATPQGATCEACEWVKKYPGDNDPDWSHTCKRATPQGKGGSVSLLTRFLNVSLSHCNGLGYTIVDGGPDCDGAQFRRDCRGCHDCKPNEYTKSHYKKRKPKPKGERP